MEIGLELYAPTPRDAVKKATTATSSTRNGAPVTKVPSESAKKKSTKK
jgi:hypothetical protein